MRDDDLYLVEVDAITFNHCSFSKILVLINHINFNKQNKKRSDFNIEEIANMVCLVLDKLELIPDGRKENMDYFVYIFDHKEKKYKLVFLIEDSEIIIEVLTLFRVRRS